MLETLSLDIFLSALSFNKEDLKANGKPVFNQVELYKSLSFITLYTPSVHNKKIVFLSITPSLTSHVALLGDEPLIYDVNENNCLSLALSVFSSAPCNNKKFIKL